MEVVAGAAAGLGVGMITFAAFSRPRAAALLGALCAGAVGSAIAYFKVQIREQSEKRKVLVTGKDDLDTTYVALKKIGKIDIARIIDYLQIFADISQHVKSDTSAILVDITHGGGQV